MSELKDCPFCGDKATVRNSHDEDGCFWAFVQCGKCSARTRGKWVSNSQDTCPIFYAEVRDEWNDRQPDERDKRIAELEEIIELMTAEKYKGE